jgi:hypothetical protein
VAVHISARNDYAVQAMLAIAALRQSLRVAVGGLLDNTMLSDLLDRQFQGEKKP